MIINNQRLVVIVKDAQVYSADEIYKRLEKPLVALKRLQQGKTLPETFRDIAVSDLEQAVFLLDGTKDLLNDNKNAQENIFFEEKE